jgi:xanthine/uracil permease
VVVGVQKVRKPAKSGKKVGTAGMKILNLGLLTYGHQAGRLSYITLFTFISNFTGYEKKLKINRKIIRHYFFLAVSALALVVSFWVVSAFAASFFAVVSILTAEESGELVFALLGSHEATEIANTKARDPSLNVFFMVLNFKCECFED